MAAVIVVMYSFSVSRNNTVQAEEVPEISEQASVDTRKLQYARPASQLKNIQSGDTETEEEFQPAPDKLNLAYFYPDDADTSDSIHSYAGIIYTDINAKNADFFASYYDMTDVSPVTMAAKQGQGPDRVMGKYNPEDSKHVKNDPSTWTVNHFKNVNVVFRDGDGNRIDGYYNAQEIMSLASVYSFFHDPQDFEAAEEYCKSLFDAATSAKVSLGNVYYCSGCRNRTVQQEADEAIEQEKQKTSKVTESVLADYENYSHFYTNEYGNQVLIPVTESTDGDAANEDSAVVSSNPPNKKVSVEDQIVVSAGKSTEVPASDASTVESDNTADIASNTENASQVNSGEQNETNNTNDVISEAPVQSGAAENNESSDGSHKKSIDDVVVVGAITNPSFIYYNGAVKRSVDDQVVVSPSHNDNASDNQTVAETTAAQIPETTAAPVPETTANAAADTGSADNGNDSEAVSISDQPDSSAAKSKVIISDYTKSNKNASQNEESQSSRVINNMVPVKETIEETSDETFTESYCPGHIDLNITITIKGIDDKNGLFKIDKIGNDQEKFTEKWNGWTEDMIRFAKALFAQDWFETYGLSISSIKTNSPLTEEEIKEYISKLPATISDERKAVIEFALNSVGKVPYYWGGKPNGPGYERNHFCRLISPDYRGRILSGLDCSGWVNWVYWSALGKPLAGQSTGTLIGCGKKISRAQLQPGDIIIRTGEDAHVVMFLQWTQNGNFIGIHETGGVRNNVFVNEMTASWPYYRALLNE